MDSKDATPLHAQHFPLKVVCVYARPDESWYQDLKTYLILWERADKITWLEMQAGDNTAQTMEQHLEQADLILLLLSPTFFAVHLCYTAMLFALQEKEQRHMPIVPIIARACDWKESACGAVNALPDNDLPIAQWPHPELAYEQIRAGLARLLPGFSSETDAQPIRPRLFQARDLPRGYVARPKAFGAIKRLLLDQQGGQMTAITTALRGAGGFGKTTLALALCHDLQIQAAFPDGILWMELGEQPSRPLDLLNALLASLDAPLSGAITLEEARDRWRTALKDRVCLLVIDDVWQAVALEPLLEGGPHCVRLITTRNDQVLPKEAARIWVDAMETEEAIAVLRRRLPEEILQGVYRPTLEALVKRLGCWPLLLTLANGMLTVLVSYGQKIAEALSIIEQAYQTHGVTAFHLDQESERQRSAYACLEVSLQHLQEFAQPHANAVERYQELVVFPEDTDIPLTTLEIFWKGTGGFEPWATKDFCICLHRLSLLQTCDLGKRTIRLHDVLRSYLEQRAGKKLIPALHLRLLDAYRQVLSLKHWADLPQSDSYMWQRLIWHLCRTGRREELEAPLTDLVYLTHKILYMGIAPLETDLLQARTYEQTNVVAPKQSFFVSLHRTIVRISHQLRQVHTQTEIGGLLLSHLGWERSFASQRDTLERELPRPFLTAWHPLPNGSSLALLRTLHGHTGSVNGCTVSPDGSWIVSASSDRTLKVWDAATGAERLTLTGHTGSVNGCTVSPDGSYVVSASSDSTLKVWDMATGEERFTLTGHTGWVSGCVVSLDGSYIVSASNDQTLKVWDAATGEERLTLVGHTGWVKGCAVSRDGSWIVSASSDRTLKVWDAATGAERLTLTGHTSTVRDCVVSGDGSCIVSASSDGTLKVWDAAIEEERFTLTGHTGWVSGCVVSGDGSCIVSASSDRTLKVWDTATGEERLTLTGHTSWVSSCAISPDGSRIVSASSDRTLKVWDATTGEERLTLTGYRNRINGCAVSSDGSRIVSASSDRTLRVWDTAMGEERLMLTGHTGWVSGCAVSPNGRWIVSTSGDQTLKVWNLVTGGEYFTLIGHTSTVSGCAVSPDSRRIVSASYDKTLRVWDAATGARRFTLIGHTSTVSGCAVSPNGHWIVSASYDKTLKVWGAVMGEERLTLTGHTSWVSSCAVSPDSRWIVSASDDQTLKVWDATTGAERLMLIGHTSIVSGCAVSPDGYWIVSVSNDKTVKIWNMQTGQCVLTFPVDGSLSGCAFHPDGEHLVACGAQGMFFLRLLI